MNTTQETTEKKKEDAVLAESSASNQSVPIQEKVASLGKKKGGAPIQGGAQKDSRRFFGGRRASGPRRPQSRRKSERARSEFDQRVVDVRRVTRVVAGGRRFNFSVALVIGDRKGSVGVGIGKASDTTLAIEKATKSAKKSMIKIKLNKNMSIPHDVSAKFSSVQISIMPAPAKGLVAGSSVRVVLELAGVRDVTAKILSRSKNKLNNARAAVKALKTFEVKQSK
ncbi:MAG: 30S ribosomal protein S5 [Candidatus Yonathbacteria bacterium CG_4_10_14_3_um_filter_47_65]|uniref:Small ribosomal subunit protein uS5 n=1 Tax=Candidatus Yonathbacteria bacterium CG_4_9_14_0_8_um_filter_46_47 TaxID=1975106 RepID=A0A2M8D5M8_9BACT|nr:MAG: 30S ribosomal protein S5 [Candidatus Yonathbacteria bacterium CG23_combo_of_CG06-09_8_20_14_all_46_18]PIQ32358.1 MAG: 30S ribosomal protein S5 [Candidatus Yonathbacteria bacterium CG17_big_fil_post_rev_8_21_14_2_50_46_19]PIX56295.1 MAG: 30S ribosomal protein S5 [Candidatus Yonathbacteria bacterium CG_4_10_14_3_um_filter_47_65]PIY57918.1 MAG: 30S ribosomal protein S5 [Candidatus Yonathbacteria bacterium CG_4_10_14_0_8_um_filter_47_645]PJB81890.1 MAG: 30S ribosomal protein S5 [Candidatus 